MFDRAYVLDGMATLQIVRVDGQGTVEKAGASRRGKSSPPRSGDRMCSGPLDVPAVWLSEGIGRGLASSP